MTVGTGEISGYIVTVIPKKYSHLLYYSLSNSLAIYCEILFKVRGFELQTELVGSMCKKSELSFSQCGLSNSVNK